MTSQGERRTQALCGATAVTLNLHTATITLEGCIRSAIERKSGRELWVKSILEPINIISRNCDEHLARKSRAVISIRWLCKMNETGML